MATTIVLRVMEKNMETTIAWWSNVGVYGDNGKEKGKLL